MRSESNRISSAARLGRPHTNNTQPRSGSRSWLRHLIGPYIPRFAKIALSRRVPRYRKIVWLKGRLRSIYYVLKSYFAIKQSNGQRYAAKARWYDGIHNELEWHEQWLATEADKSLIDRLCDQLQPIRDHVVVKCIEDRLTTHVVKVLEIGAGPISYVGYTHPHKTVQLTPTDALGKEYSQMLDYIGIHPPIRTLPCSGEELALRFPENYFDIAYASNALDHTSDPIQIVRNMLAVTKKGGVVVLRHYVNEAEDGNYEGLHQWNFDIANDEPVIWNRVHQHNLVNEFSESAKTEAFIEPSNAFGFFSWNDWVVITLTKR